MATESCFTEIMQAYFYPSRQFNKCGHSWCILFIFLGPFTITDAYNHCILKNASDKCKEAQLIP